MLVLLEQHELGFGADVHEIARLFRLRQLLLQDGARAVMPRHVVDVDVAGDPGNVLPPRQDKSRIEVRMAEHIGVVGTLAHVACRKAGETGAAVCHIINVRSRDQLCLGRAAHLHV